LFLDIGGFDVGIKSEYWQLLDFGFRSWLWGEEIRCTQLVRLRYESGKKIEDTTYDESYALFLLKNLFPVLQCDEDTKEVYATLPVKKFFSFFMTAWRAKVGLFAAIRDFALVRRWVRENQKHWITSLASIIKEWDSRQ
jgi:hypothetical protein